MGAKAGHTKTTNIKHGFAKLFRRQCPFNQSGTAQIAFEIRFKIAHLDTPTSPLHREEISALHIAILILNPPPQNQFCSWREKHHSVLPSLGNLCAQKILWATKAINTPVHWVDLVPNQSGVFIGLAKKVYRSVLSALI